MQDLFKRVSGCCFTGHRPDALPAFGNEEAEEMQSLVIAAEICEDVWSTVPPSIQAARSFTIRG